ncbi:AraC family transcriptional regulator ligand-binding domain-containing protein [Candidatus Thalassolituus haligoni]|uniref:AraC family transcriptional regulator n=1 Tax=Candidatus Thalassolituus haligoni TaxID=3100113 RepID=UPI003510E0F3
MTTPTWYECDERIFAAHYQPALLIDLLRSRDICSHKILRGTGLFYEDILQGQVMMSATQAGLLVGNASKLSKEPELSFRWGASLWPGHYDSASSLLGNAGSLRQALDALVSYRRVLSPWVTPFVVTDERYCYVHWLTLGNYQGDRRFLVEAAMSSLTSFSRWMSATRLPWRYGFSYGRPDYEEQYQVNLGDQLWFDLGMDVMVIERKWLDQEWPRGSATAYQVAQRQCELILAGLPAASLPERVYRLLLERVREPMTLPDMAVRLEMSPATLKRKLGKHGCHFQQLQDQSRLHMSLYLLYVCGWNNEQVAAHLSFNDSTNFRRAFKRWVGITPSDSRTRFSLFDASSNAVLTELAGL